PSQPARDHCQNLAASGAVAAPANTRRGRAGASALSSGTAAAEPQELGNRLAGAVAQPAPVAARPLRNPTRRVTHGRVTITITVAVARLRCVLALLVCQRQAAQKHNGKDPAVQDGEERKD